MPTRGNKKPPPTKGFWPGYLRESSRPLVSLVFALPLMLVYEAGVLALGPAAVRNGADVYMRRILDVLDFGHYFLLPLVTCAILLGWHHVNRDRWQFSLKVLPVMFVESIAWALLLLAAWRLQGLMGDAPLAVKAGPGPDAALWARVVAFCGAGLYEELLFRLILLSALIGVIRLAGGSPRATVVAAVLVTSLIFAAAHYRPFTPGGDTLAWENSGRFLFRFLAGVFFAVLFVRRGFGIAAASHAFYDVIGQELFR
jgi:membrane protease YdiL (CAAX protease family)